MHAREWGAGTGSAHIALWGSGKHACICTHARFVYSIRKRLTIAPLEQNTFQSLTPTKSVTNATLSFTELDTVRLTPINLLDLCGSAGWTSPRQRDFLICLEEVLDGIWDIAWQLWRPEATCNFWSLSETSSSYQKNYRRRQLGPDESNTCCFFTSLLEAQKL